jgi:CcmD family protein
MRSVRIWVVLAIMIVGGTLGSNAASQPQPEPPKQQEEFVPIDELPPEEQLPAAPMVVAAYGFIWVAFIAYVFTLVSRIKKVERDLKRLEQERRP